MDPSHAQEFNTMHHAHTHTHTAHAYTQHHPYSTHMEPFFRLTAKKGLNGNIRRIRDSQAQRAYVSPFGTPLVEYGSHMGYLAIGLYA